MTMQPLCSFIPSASGFGVDFGCQNTEPHEVFGGAVGQNHPFLIGQPGNTFPDAQKYGMFTYIYPQNYPTVGK